MVVRGGRDQAGGELGFDKSRYGSINPSIDIRINVVAGEAAVLYITMREESQVHLSTFCY